MTDQQVKTRTVDGVDYTLCSGIIEDVQNRSETQIWGEAVYNCTGHMNDMTINSSTSHWKQVRVRWLSDQKGTVNLPGHVNAVTGDEIDVLFAYIAGCGSLGALAYKNKTENLVWWRDNIDQVVIKNSAPKSRLLPSYGVLNAFGKLPIILFPFTLPGTLFLLGFLYIGFDPPDKASQPSVNLIWV